MSRELLILRHAKSAWDTDAPTDFDRSLAKRGRKAAPRVGRYLSEQGLIPDFLVSSPAERAKETVILVCEQLDISPGEIHWDKRIYEAWTASLVDVLRECPSHARRVLIAGHNPGMETLLRYLCDRPIPFPADGKLMPTAALAHLEISTDWDKLENAVGRLISITRSRDLS
jgi:phosphohistidine phosphatase